MNESELIDAASAWNELGLETMVFYLSIVTGYLVVAHLVGAKLLKRQIIFINTLFIVFAGFAMWGSYEDFRISAYFWTQTAASKELHGEQPMQPHHFVAILEILGILASLNFMREVRRNSNGA